MWTIDRLPCRRSPLLLMIAHRQKLSCQMTPTQQHVLLDERSPSLYIHCVPVGHTAISSRGSIHDQSISHMMDSRRGSCTFPPNNNITHLFRTQLIPDMNNPIRTASSNHRSIRRPRTIEQSLLGIVRSPRQMFCHVVSSSPTNRQ